ncbi:type II secretion system F family protein [Candidatus Woesebacteria bacterium]|nr:type II secretion system F family protein [Candidatus Woesebacteria bacterium]
MKLQSIRLSGSDKITLISNLSTMLAAGIPIMEAVRSIQQESKGNQRKVLETLESDLAAGNHVHTSFAKFPKVFNKVTVNLIKASEEAGNLETTLRDIKKNIQDEMEFSDKVKSSLMYPVFVMIVFVGVFLGILVFVVPRISTVFTRLRVELPLPTRIMIAVSDLIVGNTLELGIGLAIGVIGIVYMFRNQREVLFRMLFSLPLISKLVEQIDLTRFSRSMYLLLSSGLPIATALELAKDVVSKREVRHLISHARDTVVAGQSFAEGLRSKKSGIPGMMIKLIEVGEKSGTLDKSMLEISEYLDYHVTKNLKAATAMLEPILLVLVGVGVGAMMMSIIAPIYGLIGNVGAR